LPVKVKDIAFLAECDTTLEVVVADEFPVAAEEADAADEAGASDGASQLIRGVRRTVPSPMVVD
jgi:hypothetical protein